ncbi:MAG: methyltransferase domain-containing protein [Bryobacteraceae bacterium]
MASRCSYDFRLSACPSDPLAHLFEEWVPYYRMKWAVAAVLQPSRILEIGVRFGYSAMAFLNACPSASYLGIDINADTYGGCRDAVFWACRQLKHRKTDFLIADSQVFDQWPGGPYDLIHVDGQQDGKGTIHDLRVALRQANHVLLDGYLWTRQNFLAANEFVYLYRDLIESCFLIPGYAGDLIIRPKHEAAALGLARVGSSEQLRKSYTREYYLRDCGGFDDFKRSHGARIEDDRLLAVSTLASTGRTGRALDLGCGRGEVSLELARKGYEVTAVDYSEEAVRLAREACAVGFTGDGKIQFHCCDVNVAPIEGLYDVVIASDLVEHMAPEELDRLYSMVAGHLSPSGFFLVHTFPNLWHYQYDHARRQRLARRLGAYLPSEPRTRYELLMHINEQSPRVLRRQLARHFPHVDMWFGGPGSPADNLMRVFSRAEMRAAPDLFAVASHTQIPREQLIAPFRMEALPILPSEGVTIEVDETPQAIRRNTQFTLRPVLHNASGLDLRSVGPYPVHLSYHWLARETDESVIFDGRRTALRPFLRSDRTNDYEMTVDAPTVAGEFRLRVTLVQESVRWFDAAPESIFLDAIIRIL